MGKAFLLLILFVSSQTYAAPGFSLSGGLNFSPAKEKGAQASGLRPALWTYSLQLGYEFSNGFGAGVRRIAPVIKLPINLPADCANLLGHPAANLAPRAYMGTCNVPLLSLGFINLGASLGVGFADWGKQGLAQLESKSYPVPGNPTVAVEARFPGKTFAYLALVNLEIDAMDLIVLQGFIGYTSFGTPVDNPTFKSVLNGVTFGVGCSLKLW